MKGLFTPVPDGTYEVKSFAVDDARKNVAAFGVFRGTHTGDGGPVPPTGKRVEADYVYVMDFDGVTAPVPPGAQQDSRGDSRGGAGGGRRRERWDTGVPARWQSARRGAPRSPATSVCIG